MITTSKPGSRSSSALLLLGLLLGRELARVAALGLLAADAQVEERRAERLDLLGHRRADVEGGHDGAEPSRRCDRLQAGDARAEHENARRGDGPGRGHQHREQLRAPVGREEHRLVAGDRGLRRQRVHRLGAGDARDRLHRERDDASLAQARDAVGVGQRLEEADQHDAGRKRGDLVHGRLADPDDGVGVGEQARAVGELRAALGVLLVREPGEHARPALDDDVEPRGASFAAGVGRQGHPVFAGRGLPGHADLHLAENLREGFRTRGGNQTSRGSTRRLCDRHGGLRPRARRARRARRRERGGRGGQARLDRRALEALRLGAALHDVGKVNVRPEVLAKPGRLDDGELAEIRAHPVEGMWLIAGVPSLRPALPYVLFHHERWDGLGYPTRRAGAAIPLEGRDPRGRRRVRRDDVGPSVSAGR